MIFIAIGFIGAVLLILLTNRDMGGRWHQSWDNEPDLEPPHHMED